VKNGNKKIKQEKRGVLHFISKSHHDSIKLRRDATIFGREKGDILINDAEISSTHCQIQNINGTFHIFDMNSTNGTFVNGERIVKAKLANGDTVTIGQTIFRFQIDDEQNLRHISTIFKLKEKKGNDDSKSSIVDTLIENELKETPSLKVHIYIKYHDGTKDHIELLQRHIYVGRASSFGRFENDPEISRKHLLIKVNDTGEVFIEDQGSTNGSFLNGKRITGMHPVKPTDEVKVGTSRLKIQISPL
jgi:pSer/pThr/pTyr-binding forkhead associated (FHA) protein